MNRLSSPITSIKSHYDVVVVGSGYGGAISASRLARAGKSVCVLERGRERQPGEYPATTLEASSEFQLDLPAGHSGSRTGLFDLRVNKEISVLVGCGLGGTSLINANISIRPDMRIFEDPRWPEALRKEQFERLNKGYALAEAMLGANPYPADLPTPPKLAAHEKSAQGMGVKFTRLNLNVTFKDGYNHAGLKQKACTLCGDCVSGCNHSAKNTVLMNYLPDARRHGAEIFVEASVRRVERRQDGKWAVHYQLVRIGRETYDAETMFVTGDVVILAAGALGSTEILMRSREEGKLALSNRLGAGFGGNGDMLGFGYNATPEVRSVGLGQKVPVGSGPVDAARVIGPTITSIVDLRGSADWRQDMIIAEGAIPAVLAPILPGVQKAAAAAAGVNTAPGNLLAQRAREADGMVRGAYHGAPNHTQTYLGMCHDNSNGTMSLDDDRLRIAWEGIGKTPIFEKMNQRLQDVTRPLEGIYIKNPIWSDVLGKSLITVHPLGGCNMANSAEGGVVDHACRVFSSNAGTAVHQGLYVCDGAVVPAALGVNPLLTISALTERACMIMAEERGFTIDYAEKGPIQSITQETKIGVRFTESMKGWYAPASDTDYTAAAKRGEKAGSAFQFIVTIAADDVDVVVTDDRHEARMVGTVTAPQLSPKPLVVTEGVFNLFMEDPNTPGQRLMQYRMILTADDGREFHFHGFKTIRNRPIWDLWKDNTTLFITIRNGRDENAPVLGIGILRIKPDDFIRLLSTIDATNTTTHAERTEATVKFGRFFAGTLYDKYGGIAAPPVFAALGSIANIVSFADEGAAPRNRRPLRAPAPEFFPITAEDGAEIVLTRYADKESGTALKGPVILAHGLGTSSEMFSIDTVETNLVEYLTAEGYDVWLFDHRASALLPGARGAHTADDVARKDWPAAVAAVRDATGAATVQVVAHGLGAATFSMAMLAGLTGVRSAVCSQLATHVVTGKASLMRGGLYAPDAASALGFETLAAAAAGDQPDWVTPLFERAGTLDPGAAATQPCESDACARIRFMYGDIIGHEKVDEATHAALYEIFTDPSPQFLQSVTSMVKAGHVVDAAGEDAYLPHLDRLAIPLRLLHGAENKAFLPESTEQTAAALAARSSAEAGVCSRVVIPGYGHDDCILGKNAATDVYPHILEHLGQT